MAPGGATMNCTKHALLILAVRSILPCLAVCLRVSATWLRWALVLVLSGLITGPAHATDNAQARLVCVCFLHTYALYIADADGREERALLPPGASSYDASFSADGHWIVFTSERSGSADIYRVHPDGTGLEQLTNSPSFEDQGALSPDGRTLAFVSTRGGGMANIWLLDLKTGRSRNLTPSSAGNFRPAWSPDGQWIAFSSNRDTALVRDIRPTGGQAWEWMQLNSIYLIRADGTGLRRLTPLDQIAGSPKWSPDGRHLVYYQVSNLKEIHEGKGPARAQIKVMDLSTSAVRDASSDSVFNESPQYLGGQEIAYLTVVPASGGTERRLAYSSSGRTSVPHAMDSPAWSPDGRFVVYHRREDPEAPWAQRLATLDPRYQLIGGHPFLDTQTVAFTSHGDRFYYVSAAPGEGTQRVRLGSLQGSEAAATTVFDTGDSGRIIGALSLSPDQRSIAIEIGALMQRPPLPAEIDVVGTDGSGLKRVLEGSAAYGFPGYSPDGESLVYRVLGQEQGLRIRSLRDGHVSVLTQGWDNFPAWSAPAGRIAFTRLENNTFEIYTIRPDGSGLRQLTHSHGTDAHPVWSPDGQWLAFVSARRGFKDESIHADANQPYGEIFVMRADGSEVRQLTDDRYEEGVLAWLP